MTKHPHPLPASCKRKILTVHYEEDITQLPAAIDLVVYTPAIPATNTELIYFQTHGYKVVKRSDILKIITETSFNICVAGTHGKTTVSTMIAHILRHSGYGCNAFLGGISANYNTNFWTDKNNVCVIEADEYDRSFLKLSPDIAVITSMDPDHLDIYGTAKNVEDAFIAFSEKTKPGGCLINKVELTRNNELKGDRKLTYSFENTAANVYAQDVRIDDGSYVFDIVGPDWLLTNVRLHMGGLHNIENIVAAVTVAKNIKIDEQKIKDAIADFRGVKRRFEYLLNETIMF